MTNMIYFSIFISDRVNFPLGVFGRYFSTLKQENDNRSSVHLRGATKQKRIQLEPKTTKNYCIIYIIIILCRLFSIKPLWASGKCEFEYVMKLSTNWHYFFLSPFVSWRAAQQFHTWYLYSVETRQRSKIVH